MKLVVVIPTNRPQDWENIKANLGRQLLQPDAVIIVENGHDHSWATDVTHVLKSDPNPGDARRVGVDLAKEKYPNSFICMMDGDDYYAKNYLRELWDNKNKADVIGKHTVYYWLNATQKLAVTSGSENSISKLVLGPTMSFILTKDIIDFADSKDWYCGEDWKWQQKMKDAGAQFYATSRNNFTGVRRVEVSDHIWSVPDVVASDFLKMKQVVKDADASNWQKFCELENNELVDFSDFAFNMPDVEVMKKRKVPLQ